MHVLLKLFGVIWASPNTLLGMILGGVGLCTGGRVQFRRGCLEFHGGLVRWLVRRLPPGESTMAFTLGHTILGQNSTSLELAREHEHVHVRQYERWGPLFLVAYLGISLGLWIAGRDPYRDNPFEVAAYRHADVREDAANSES
jgi:hypothetical protein